MMILRKRKSVDEVKNNKESIIVKKRKIIDESKNKEERGIVKKRKSIDDEEDRSKKNRVISKKRRNICEEEEHEQKRIKRTVVKKGKSIDDQNKKINLSLKKCKTISEEDENEQKRIKRVVVKKGKLIDEDEDQNKKNRLILKKCKKIDGEEDENEQNRIRRVIVRERKKFGEEEEQNRKTKSKRIGEEDENEQNRKKKVTVRKGKELDQDKKQTVERKCKKIDDDEEVEEQKRKKIGYLPEELVIENILTRLPAQKLAQCRCVSKLLYNTIFNDERFAELQFVHNKNDPYLVFNRLNVNSTSYLFKLEEDNDHLLYCKSLIDLSMKRSSELVGYCNGLTCLRQVSYSGDEGGLVCVINPTRGESLGLYYLTPSRSCAILCHGFGFDSSSGKYKVVVIYTAVTAASHGGGQSEEEFLCMVGTLGSNSWRKIVTRTSELSPLPGCSPYPFITVVPKASRSATLCGGHLFWRVTNMSKNNKIEMLLSFDMHTEKIEFIRLPTECTLTPETTTVNEHHHHHLLEFKGYPCVARSEKIMMSNSDDYDHCGHCSKDQRSLFCHCFKVHLYILKDKVEQVWIKGETFDVQIKDEGLLATPFSCSSGTTTASTVPPTRIVSFSDQLLLYWFDGVCLTFYNLQTKHLKVAKVSQSYDKRDNDDDTIYCPTSDYQLHTQVENIISMKSFISGGEIRKFDRWDDVTQALGSIPAAWVRTGRESVKYYALL